MSSVGETQQAARGIENAVKAGDEHLRGHVGAEVLVHPFEDEPRLEQSLRGRAQHASGCRHDERRRHPLVGDVPDHETNTSIRQGDHVVEVAADLPCGPVKGVYAPARKIGQLLWQEVLLDQPGDLELLLEALPGRRLRFLLADELPDPKRRRRLRSEVVEQLAIIGRILLSGEPAPELQHSDQLALADERHRQLDPLGPHLIQGLGVEGEALDLHSSTSALQVGQQRIVDGDVGCRLHRSRGRNRSG